MSRQSVSQLQQTENESKALYLQYNRWSRVMIRLLIREQEHKLVESGQPVEEDAAGAALWEQVI